MPTVNCGLACATPQPVSMAICKIQMKEMLKRNNNTSLSDDELIIFDVLFDTFAPINFLKCGDDFELMFNHPSHSLDVNRLKDTIERFVKNNLMRFKLNVFPKDDQIVTFIGLTEKGGDLWEKERLPIWDKFISDSSYDYKGFWELSVSSPSLETAKKFIKIAQECKLYELMNPNDIEVDELRGSDLRDLIPWKTFDKIYEIKSRLSDNDSTENGPETDWKLYRLKSLWWRDADELQRLHEKINI